VETAEPAETDEDWEPQAPEPSIHGAVEATEQSQEVATESAV
jgi:hypothetical protein